MDVTKCDDYSLHEAIKEWDTEPHIVELCRAEIQRRIVIRAARRIKRPAPIVMFDDSEIPF